MRDDKQKQEGQEENVLRCGISVRDRDDDNDDDGGCWRQ